jgi:HEPN domain-containing protein
MKNKILFLGFVFFLIIPTINAGLFNSGDITFSVNQKEYYFKTGENAIIPLEIENTYGKQINGMLSYTYTQEINQGGMHMSSSNTQSTSFSVEEGKNTENLNFGTSNSPSTLSISLKYSYTDKETRIVNLDEIKIHFVSDENQKQNKENKQASSSEKYSAPQQNQQQDPFSQMQKEIDEMMGRNQQQNSQTTEQKMQNNQIGQDSSALKKQMERQLQEQEQLKQEFQKQLSKNQEFQQEHQKLLQQGYNLTSGDLKPSSEDSGKFDLQYQKQNGEKAQLKGEMENGEIKNIQKLTQEDKEEIIKKLNENKDFKKLNKELQEENFNQKNMEFSLEENKTKIKVNYRNPQNQTNSISADVINGTIQNVRVENLNEEDKNYFLIFLIILIILLLIGSYFIYKKYYKKTKKVEKEIKNTIIEKPFDYKSEAKKLLNKSKILFQEKRYKDAYEKAGQSLRLYLSYKYGLKKEITNDEIIRILKNKNKEIKPIKECFDLCSLVEFAKYDANKKDFEKIIKLGEEIINK